MGGCQLHIPQHIYSVLYVSCGNYTCKQVDFIQLGYLVLYLLVGKDIIKPTAIVLVYYIGKENIDEMSYHSMDIDTLKYVTDSECRTIIQQLLKGIKQ